MNMKLKMSVLAGALALAVAGQANATIVTGTTGSSDLILSIWDTTSLTSYTRDLGVNMSSFLAGVSGINTALVASSASLSNATYAADGLLTSFLSGVNLATTVWNVTALDNAGTTAFQGKQLLSTTNANIKSAANSLASAQANSTVLTAIGNADFYYANANGAAGAAATSVTATSADSWYANSNLFGPSGSTKLSFNTTAGIGSSLNFWYLTPSSTTAVAKASVAQFGNTAGVSTWTLASNGTLSFAAPVAAVPEPGEWALMLSGFGLIGFIALRRKNQNTSMTFA